MKCQKLVFFSKKKNETYFHYQQPKILKKSKYQQYFHYFIVCILSPYACGLASSGIK